MICHPELRALHPDGECVICPTQVTGYAPRVELSDLQYRIKVEKGRRSLLEFLRLGWHVLEPDIPLEMHWHIVDICRHVQWMFDQWAGVVPDEANNLAINVPPGSLKSRVVSVYGPAWAWLHWPRMSLLCLSSTPEVARRDADYNKELIQSSWYRETFGIDWSIKPGKDARGLFETTVGGVRHSQGLNAKVTGVRRDIILIDDPNDAKDVTDTKLRAVERNWLAARNRVNDPRRARRILIQQRVHARDLTGVVMGQGGWEHLCIPMELPSPVDDEGKPKPCPCGRIHCDTPIGKRDPRKTPGEVLHPERNTPEVLAQERTAMGSLVYAGQMNQRPAPDGGELFKTSYWRYYDELPMEMRGGSPHKLLIGPGVMSVDSVFKEGGTSRVGIVCGAQWQANTYVLHAFAKSMGAIETVKTIKQIRDTLICPLTGKRLIEKILIEPKANGETLVEMLRDEIGGIITPRVKGDKVSRTNACLPRVESGNVYLQRHSPWVDEFKSEHAAFPRGAYDDLVDAFSQLMSELLGGSLSKVMTLCAP